MAALAAVAASPAAAQLLRPGVGGGLEGVVNLPGPGLRDVPSALTGVMAPLDPQHLLNARRARLDAVLRAYPHELERGPSGEVLVRGVVLAVDPTPDALARAQREGFAVQAEPVDPDLDLRVVRLQAPEGMSARAALARMRALDPPGVYDFDPIYGSAGVVDPPRGAAAPSPAERQAAAKIGLIDTGVDGSHPAFARARIEQKGFASPEAIPAAHGTATASLIVGEAGRFEGVAPGATLLVADVYGRSITGGAGDLLVQALAWTAARGARVVNMSLVGPPNLAVGAAVRAVQARGILIVAPVGNDGPAAPPAYPASYPGVVAVTGVDGLGRVLIEAGRASHLDFAAPGADLQAASISGGFATVRGTSFAAPIVTGRLALAEAAGASGPAAITAVAATSRRGPGYGKGLVAAQVQTASRR
ncbi:MAG TPA: S8 family serine peptidase [Caulobacteraceae bacterium]